MVAVPEPSHETPPGDPPQPPGRSPLRAVISTARPKQWTKNVLVFAAPAAAGVLDQGDELVKTLVAFVAFCLAASATYLLNDSADAVRLHPTNRNRPIAAGELSPAAARGVAIGLIIVACAMTAPINNGKLT